MTENIYSSDGPVKDSAFYITRDADRELLDHCLAGEYSYIFCQRQMGKTSLIYRTKDRLKELNNNTALVDITSIGEYGIDAYQWFFAVLKKIIQSVSVPNLEKFIEWWKKNKELSTPSDCFKNSLADFVLKSIDQPLVVFVDEIDKSINRGFSKDFMDVIRSMYIARSEQPEFEKVIFVLLGQARLSDLQKSHDTTPYNIGERVELKDFSIDEIMPLAGGLSLELGTEEKVMTWILQRTGGQPYLTQRLCINLAKRRETIKEELQVENALADMVRETKILEHFDYIKSYLTQEKYGDLLLRMYGYIISGNLVYDDLENDYLDRLKLSGVLTVAKGILVSKCPIYYRYIGLEWIRREMLERNANFPENYSIARKYIRNRETTSDASVPLSVETNKEIQEREIDIKGKKIPHEHFQQYEVQPVDLFDDTDLMQNDDALFENGTNFFDKKEKKNYLIEYVISSIRYFFENFKKIVTLFFVALIMIFVFIVIPYVGITVYGVDWKLCLLWFTLLLLNGTGFVVSLRSDRMYLEERIGRYLGDWNEQSDQKSSHWNFTSTQFIRPISLWGRISDQLAKADLKIKPFEFFAFDIFGGLAFVFWSWFVGGWNIFAMLIFGIIGLLLPWLYIKRIQIRRTKEFELQIENFLDVMVNGLRAGYSTMQAMEVVSRELPAPLSNEFRRVVQEMQLGIPMEEALDHLTERIPSPILWAVVTAMKIQREVGGNLSEALDNKLARLKTYSKIEREIGTTFLTVPMWFYYLFFVVIQYFQKYFINSYMLLNNEAYYGITMFYASQIMIVVPLFMVVIASWNLSDQQIFSKQNIVVGIIVIFLSVFLKLPYVLFVALVCILLQSRPVIYFVKGLIKSIQFLFRSGFTVALILFLTSFFLMVSGQHNLIDYFYKNFYFVLKSWLVVIALYMISSIYGNVRRRAHRVLYIVSIAMLTIISIFLFETVLQESAFLNMLLLYVNITLSLFIFVYLLINAASFTAIDDSDDRLTEFSQRGELVSLSEIEAMQPVYHRVILPLLHKIGDFFSTFTPQFALLETEKKLEWAGMAGYLNSPVFMVSKFLIAILFGYLAYIFSDMVQFYIHLRIDTIGLIIFALIGYCVPTIWLDGQVFSRQNKIRKEFPDILDLLVICSEVGLGLYAAMSVVVEKASGEIPLVFSRTIREIQLGKPSRDALYTMADHVGMMEMNSLVAAMIQSEQLGISIANIFRNQSFRILDRLKENLENENFRVKSWGNVGISVFGLSLIFWLLSSIIDRIIALQ